MLAPALIEWTISLIMCGVFLFSSLKKWRNPYGFAKIIESYRLIHNRSAIALSVLLVSLELGVALMLVLPQARVHAGLLLALMQVLFLGAQALRLGEELPYGCGCFFLHGPRRLTLKSLAVNALLLVMSLWLIRPLLGGGVS